MMTIETQKPLAPSLVTNNRGEIIRPGDVMQYNRYGIHLRQLRDGYLREGRPSDRSMKKQWYDDALAKRFIVTESGHNGYCQSIRYKIENSNITGECMADQLEAAK